MPLIETKGAASAQGFGEFAKTGVATYIEDVFSTWLYTGNGSTQTITNGIDLSGKGGLVWVKSRSVSGNNWAQDTARGVNSVLYPNLTNAAGNPGGTAVSSFDTTGFTLGTNTNINNTGDTYASWTFRKQAKFFDVVTYTGNNTAGRTVSHNLGSVPGCIIVKRTDTTSPWTVYHRSVGATKYLELNGFGAPSTSSTRWNDTTPTSTVFTLGGNDDVNAAGGTYVAYLFAHDAGGFGLTGTDSVIKCDTFTTDGTGSISVSIGWEPQWLLVKDLAGNQYFQIVDNMRGLNATAANAVELYAGLTQAETKNGGFAISSFGFSVNQYIETDYIYIAIRRGPMKTPTSGTSVFAPVVYTGTNVDNRLVDMGLLTDMTFARQRDSASVSGMVVGDRLRGDPYLLTGSTNAENADADSFMTPTVGYGNAFSSMVGFGVGNDATSRLNISTTTDNQIAEGFRRAPGVFDVVCYTGTGSARSVNHNLTVVPQLIIAKKRSAAGSDFLVYSATIGATKYLILNGNNAEATFAVWNDTAPTSSVFSVGTDTGINASGATYVAYLFATVAGVSKVGSYTGTGTTLQVDCGFTGGARFVLIKRTDSNGDWYVWDSARGIVAGNDPYLLLNSAAGEVGNTDYVDTYSAGFEISSTAPAGINANGGTFIFLAIA